MGTSTSLSPSPSPPSPVLRFASLVAFPLPPRAPPSPSLLSSLFSLLSSLFSLLSSPLPSSSSSLSRKPSCPSIPSSIPSAASSQFTSSSSVRFFVPSPSPSLSPPSTAALSLPLPPSSSSRLPSSRVSSSSPSSWPLSTCSSCPLLLVASPLASSLPLSSLPLSLSGANGPPSSPSPPSPSPSPSLPPSIPAALCFTLVSAMSAVAAVLSVALCAPRYSRLLLLRISSRTRTASCSLLWLADMHPKFHASSSFVTSIFLQYLANAVRACWGVIAFGSAFVPALYPISLRWLLYESPYDHVISWPSLTPLSANRTITCAAALPNCISS